jgi:hypothetical protein
MSLDEDTVMNTLSKCFCLIKLFIFWIICCVCYTWWNYSYSELFVLFVTPDQIILILNYLFFQLDIYITCIYLFHHLLQFIYFYFFISVHVNPLPLPLSPPKLLQSVYFYFFISIHVNPLPLPLHLSLSKHIHHHCHSLPL